MLGNMMDQSLLLSSFIEYAAKFHGKTEIVSADVDDAPGRVFRYNYGAARDRAVRLAQALQRLDVNGGDRIATMCWNSYRHYELFFAVPGIGAVLHTINSRLSAEQIAYTANHAEDRVLFFDLSFLKMVEQLAPQLPTIRTYVALTTRERLPASTLPGLVAYESLLDAENGDFNWPQLDERNASALCFSSGTTGNPKGALYSHRSSVLHTLGVCMIDAQGISGAECLLPVTPMFHANAWGSPYSATASGAKLVLAGQCAEAGHLTDLIVKENVTLAFAVPTVWRSVLDYAGSRGGGLGMLKRVMTGGTTAPPAMIEEFRDVHGIRVMHAWGMTEMNPFGSAANLLHKHHDADQATLDNIYASQGRPPCMVDFKLVDDKGNIVQHDGKTPGNLYSRGPWVIKRYYKNPEADAEAFDSDGWFRTGDVCTIDADGYMRIVDRTKDLIKSGGEWISSVALESAVSAYPGIVEAAAIAVPHPKWDERPLLLVVARQGLKLEPMAIFEFLKGRVEKWWLPDEILVVAELPHNAAGKVLKNKLREAYRSHRLANMRGV